MTEEKSASSKREALKSTSIIGGATAITIVIRMVRTKVLAVLLGPAGIGLEALYDSVVTLVKTVFDLGLSSSGVRQIAASTETGDLRRIATTVSALQRTCVVAGAAGALTLYLGREWASRAAFGNDSHATAFGWLAGAVFLGIVAGGFGALLQGLRRVGDLARMNIIGTAVGAVTSIPIVYTWGQAGIPAYMIAVSLVMLFVAWHYARRAATRPMAVRTAAISTELRALLKLGIAFMLTALIATTAAFLVRALVVRGHSLAGAGQFQAATALSLMYVGFVLQAMGTDFYPRLTAVADDNHKSNRMVNEQAEISLLLALPGVLATIALAPWVMRVFYTGSFDVAAQLLSWQMTGMLLRVMSWPLGFLTLAKGRAAIFLWTDLLAWSVYVALAWLGLKWFGLSGAGMAFLGLYVFHVGLMYGVARVLSGFRWNRSYLRYAGISLAACVLILWMRLRWPEPWATAIPVLLAVGAGAHSFRLLIEIIGTERFTEILNRPGISWVRKILGIPL